MDTHTVILHTFRACSGYICTAVSSEVAVGVTEAVSRVSSTKSDLTATGVARRYAGSYRQTHAYVV